jgi:predicted nuclease of predicted toxin-antitoxin system
MMLRLLIDECLSPDLVELAIQAGHIESTCLRDRGLLGTQDWRLMKYVLAEDFTLVTVNAQDFRGGGHDTPGGLYSAVELHAGLVCLNSVRHMDLNTQRELFEIALEELAALPDLINQVLEVTEEASGEVAVTVYELPAATH